MSTEKQLYEGEPIEEWRQAQEVEGRMLNAWTGQPLDVYVLFGATGAYSDYSEWVVCGYEKQADADADCAALNKLAEGIEKMQWADRDNAVAERVRAHDPHAHCDGLLHYNVAKIEVYSRRRVPEAT